MDRKLGRELWLLIGAVACGGAAVVAGGLAGATTDDWKLLLALVALGALAERFAVGLFDSHVSIGAVTVLIAAAVGGLWGVALVAPAVVVLGELRSRRPWYKRLYNVGTYLLAGAAFAGIFRAFDDRALPDEWPAVLIPAILGAAANYTVNAGLVAAAVGLSERQSPLRVWRDHYLWVAPQYAVVGAVAVAAATAYHMLGLWGLAVFAAPALGIRHAYALGGKVAPARAPKDHLRPAA